MRLCNVVVKQKSPAEILAVINGLLEIADRYIKQDNFEHCGLILRSVATLMWAGGLENEIGEIICKQAKSDVVTLMEVALEIGRCQRDFYDELN